MTDRRHIGAHMPRVIFSVITLVSAAIATNAVAQSRDQNWQHCAGNSDDLRIAACTAIIQSKQEVPENLAIAFNDRGNAYEASHQYDAAIKDYDEAIKLKPTFAEVFYNRGNAYYLERKYERAINDYDEAIKLKP